MLLIFRLHVCLTFCLNIPNISTKMNVKHSVTHIFQQRFWIRTLGVCFRVKQFSCNVVILQTIFLYVTFLVIILVYLILRFGIHERKGVRCLIPNTTLYKKRKPAQRSKKGLLRGLGRLSPFVGGNSFFSFPKKQTWVEGHRHFYCNCNVSINKYNA